MGRGEPAFGGKGLGRGEVCGVVVGCVVRDADFDLWGEGMLVDGMEMIKAGYLRLLERNGRRLLRR